LCYLPNNAPVKIDDYPAIKKHLDGYFVQLEKRGDKGLTPYNLRQCAYLKEFEKEKIVWADLSRSGNCFTFDDKNLYLQNTGYIMTGVSLKYLIAVLNTKLILHYFDEINQKLDNTGWRWINQYVEILPIPKIPETEQQPFIKLVDKILAEKKAGNDTSALEREIDVLVYGLYGLSEEEILIVEGK
jgi:type II restriction/modification system DNA methylase subunit YeeA